MPANCQVCACLLLEPPLKNSSGSAAAAQFVAGRVVSHAGKRAVANR